MIHWVFVSLTLAAAAVATFSSAIRVSILALWIAGLGAGAFYLTIGAELLAVIQWIISTLVAISFVFFAVMFGEYNPTDTSASSRRGGLIAFAAIAMGAVFPVVIWLSGVSVPEAALIPPTAGNDIAALGRKLAQENFVSLEVLALTLLVVLVGGGIIARPERKEEEEA